MKIVHDGGYRVERSFDDEKQKLMFVFDYLNERLFISSSPKLSREEPEARLHALNGHAPVQIMEPEEVLPISVILDTEESLYGDESFDPDELDVDGFEALDDLY